MKETSKLHGPPGIQGMKFVKKKADMIEDR
jgi:hypothetical protein